MSSARNRNQGRAVRDAQDGKPSNIQQPVPPTNPNNWLATLYHLGVSVFYLWFSYSILILFADNAHKLDPKANIPKYGGPFKYLTFINQNLQFLFFVVQFLTDILPKSSVKRVLKSVCDFSFTTILFPLALNVTGVFWCVYAIDRSLIYPDHFDLVIPLYINHFWHTAISLWVILDILVCSRQYPSSGVAATMIFVIHTAYNSWVVWIFVKTRYWVYGFLGVLPPALLTLFFGAGMFWYFGLYLLGRAISSVRWGQRV